MQHTVQINSNEYTFTNAFKDNTGIRLSFDALAQKTFGLSFENWYKNGYWQDKYIPHVLIHNGVVVSNVSVNIMDICWNGCKKRYIQLGTVMTHPEYRYKGLSNYLLKMVLHEWSNKCNGMYLFANDSVLEFYPKYGFVKANEHQCSMPVTPSSLKAKKLNMDHSNDIKLLLKMYHEGNPFSKLSMIDNDGLIMFYCSQYMKDCVYYCEDLNVVVIAEFNNNCMVCYDIFGNGGNTLNDILACVATGDTKTVHFGFTPCVSEKMDTCILKEVNTTLFILEKNENLFINNQIMFPLLSHA